MKRILLALLLVASMAQAHFKPSRDMLQEIQLRTFLITTDSNLGNGIVIKDGRLLTVAHITGGQFIVNSHPVKLLRSSYIFDLALLEVPTLGETKLGPMPEVGDTVFTTGYTPGMGGAMTTTGQVTRIDGAKIITDMPVFPGNSGQGVYNEDGKLVGLVQGGLLLCEEFCQPLSYLISVDIVRVFLSQGD